MSIFFFFLQKKGVAQYREGLTCLPNFLFFYYEMCFICSKGCFKTKCTIHPLRNIVIDLQCNEAKSASLRPDKKKYSGVG